jgi:O-antigen polysaccharide polymerase Wzy-like protein
MKILFSHFCIWIAFCSYMLIHALYEPQVEHLLKIECLGVTAISIWCVVSWKIVRGRLFGPYLLFLLAAVLFNAGQAVVQCVQPYRAGSIFVRFDEATLIRTVALVSLGILSLHLGALCAVVLDHRNNSAHVAVDADWLRHRAHISEMVGYALVGISIVPWIITFRERLDRVYQYGYFTGTFGHENNYGIYHTPEILAQFLVPGAIFLLVGKQRLGMILSMIVVAVYSAAMLFAGSKGFAIMSLSAYAWVWHQHIAEIPKKVIVAGGLIIVLLIIPVVTATRDTPAHERLSAEFLWDSYKRIDNPLIASFAEMGWSASTVAYTLQLVPSARPHDNGRSYGFALLGVVPNVFGGIHPTRAHGSLSTWLVSAVAPAYAAKGGGFGYTFIAEAYTNFGWFGAPIAIILIGYVLSWSFLWAERTSDPARLALVGSWLSSLLIFARGESATIVRSLVWYSLIPYVLVLLFSNRSQQSFTTVPAEHRELTNGETPVQESAF